MLIFDTYLVFFYSIYLHFVNYFVVTCLDTVDTIVVKLHLVAFTQNILWLCQLFNS